MHFDATKGVRLMRISPDTKNSVLPLNSKEHRFSSKLLNTLINSAGEMTL